MKVLIFSILCSLQVCLAAHGFRKQEAFPALKFNRALFLTSPNDQTDRIFVVEQGGLIKVFPNKESVGQSEVRVFLDIRSKMSFQANEEGLLGLAFDPLYSRNGRFYVYYTKANPRRTVLSRFRVSNFDSNQANLASEEVLLEIPQPFSNHNGGMLSFGPDGMLYIAVGDGGSGKDPQNNGQNIFTLLGSILRIDVNTQRSYRIPSDNPFAQSFDGRRKEIYAYGVRNPWRFSFDIFTKELWVADVGEQSFEEINIVKNGDNLGWRLFEGFQSHLNPFNVSASTIKQPLHVYSRDKGTSITGGYVYRGDKLKKLYGSYVYADFSSGRVWKLKKSNGKVVENLEIENVPMPASFGQDSRGEIYILSMTGTIYKLTEVVGTIDNSLPNKLSETGLFTDVVNFQLNPNFVKYEVNMPLWSDGVNKSRFISIPQNKFIQTDGNWSFPIGTVIIKDFRQPRRLADDRRLETRVMKKNKDGWVFASYKWNAQQTEAFQVRSSETESISIFDKNLQQTKQTEWTYPDSVSCLSCHTGISGRVLGVEERQINRKNQLQEWLNKGIIKFNSGIKNLQKYPDYHAEVENSENFVKAYFDVNCSSCHQPQGPTSVNIDFRFTTSIEKMNIINVNSSDMSPIGQILKRVSKGDPDNSSLLQRMLTTGQKRMPRLGTKLIDEKAVKEIKKWIQNLK